MVCSVNGTPGPAICIMSNQVRVLILNKDDNLETTLFRLQKGWLVHFMLGPTLYTHHVRLFCNHPTSNPGSFDRNQYRELPWELSSIHGQDKSDMFAELRCSVAGAFRFYFTIDDSEQKRNGQGYFLVDPTLRIGLDNHHLHLDSVTCQTVLTKCLGPFEEWESRLRVSKESGYNMIHFTPVQELGVSNSSYSIKNQLKFNSFFCVNGQYDMVDVEKLVQHMKNDWNVLSMTDLVYNHTAVNSGWLEEHPECAYNLVNSPHLKPAYVLDRILWYFTLDVGSGKYEFRNLPSKVKTEKHLSIMGTLLREKILPSYKLNEFYQINVEDSVRELKRKALEGAVYDPAKSTGNELFLIQDPQYRRLKCTVNVNLALKLYNVDRPGCRNRDERIRLCCEEFEAVLQELNRKAWETIEPHIEQAVQNFLSSARYRFVDSNGPQFGAVSPKNPLVDKYFYYRKCGDVSVERDEADMNIESETAHIMACNGWVMGDDPLKNFAEPDSNVYLRRELLPWGDSVKLCYGKKPEDSPYLWNHMLKYTQETARIFHAVRLDNCHSTPLHVAEYMLDAARQVDSDLWVVAELFTNSDQTDNIFINHLGINSLIREAMTAWDSHEEGRLVYRYGGEPVGAFIQPQVQPLTPAVAHACFMDVTHDNPSPVKTRSVYDLLPTGAIVSSACCAIGSTRTYDELCPHHVHVVDEARLYSSWTDLDPAPRGTVNHKSGIISAKRAINNLHYELGKNGHKQVFVDQIDRDTVAVTRHNPVTHETVVIVSRTAFSHPGHARITGYIPPVTLFGNVEEIIYEAKLVHTGHSPYEDDPLFLKGLPDFEVVMREYIKPHENGCVALHGTGNHYMRMEFTDFPPGSTIALRISMPEEVMNDINQVRYFMQQLGYALPSSEKKTKSYTLNAGERLRTLVQDLTLVDLNRVLYRCDGEEKDDGLGISAYDIPNYGPLKYCGLQGIMSVLSKLRATNDLGHPFFGNLRDGNWLVDYTSSRLVKHSNTAELGKLLEILFEPYKRIPHHLRPCYFDGLMTGIYIIILDATWNKMNLFVKDGTSFVRHLALGSVQFCGIVPTSKLPGLSPSLVEPRPEYKKMTPDGVAIMWCPSLAAGFPHFSHGIMRNWGRDTFISFRGLFLLTGRYQEARYVILAFAGCLRHGLMPNLLGEGVGARFNCRDATWFWLQSIQDYCKLAPDGLQILQDKVHRLYPDDDVGPMEPGEQCQPLCDVIQEAVQRHAEGVEYRESGAGWQLDENMSDDGFNNKIGVSWETGFVIGGTEHNCGTWMDKMGSSQEAGNKGKPATPRDGSAVEIVGLCKSAVRWLANLSSKKLYPYDTVTANVEGMSVKVTFKEWNKKLKQNFEKLFWVHTEPVPEHEPSPELINKRGIYKDTYFATQFWTDYQLRPNYPVAMVVAPEMFTPENAWIALETIEKHLLGPLGLKTLDPGDWAYCGDYNNSDRSGDPKTAHGFNYHNGPEWLWPMGFFLRAKLYFAKVLNKKHPGILNNTVSFVQSVLSRHQIALQASDWRSLPELTNADGKECPDGCPAQAWSVACLLEVLYDLENM